MEFTESLEINSNIVLSARKKYFVVENCDLQQFCEWR